MRVFSAADGTKLQELRRGSDPARIYSLAFSHGDQPDWLAVSSDKGTAHVFSLAGGGRQPGARGGGGGGNGRGQQPGDGGDAGRGAQGRGNPLSSLSFVSVSARVGACALQGLLCCCCKARSGNESLQPQIVLPFTAVLPPRGRLVLHVRAVLCPAAAARHGTGACRLRQGGNHAAGGQQRRRLLQGHL